MEVYLGKGGKKGKGKGPAKEGAGRGGREQRAGKWELGRARQAAPVLGGFASAGSWCLELCSLESLNCNYLRVCASISLAL